MDVFSVFRSLRGEKEENDEHEQNRKRRAAEMDVYEEHEQDPSETSVQEDAQPHKRAKTSNEHDSEGAQSNAAASKYTTEQQAVIDTRLSLSGVKYMEIQAFAGTGKSYTLNEWIKKDGKPVLDLLYNRGMADRASTEAEEEHIRNMTAKTWHQLPFMFLMGKEKQGYKLASKKSTNGSDKATDVDNSFKARFAVWVKKQRGLLPALSIEQEHAFWSYTLSTLRSFAKSARTSVDDKDLHHLIKMHCKHKHILAERAQQPEPPKGHRKLKWLPVPSDVKRVAQAIMTAIENCELLEINFDIALKLVHLKGIRLDSRWPTIAMDEAQDLTEVMLEIIKIQKDNCCLITVGDTRQTINQWNNTCDAMKLLRQYYTDNQRVLLHLTETFRFSQQLADAINWLFQCFDPLDKPVVSHVKESTELLPTPATDSLKLIAEIMEEVKRSPDRRVGIISRTKAQAIELIENFASVADGSNLSNSRQTRLRFSCCGSIKIALQTIVKLSQMTDQQLHLELTKAEENENLERVETIEALLKKKNRKRYAAELQTIMGFQTSQEQCNVFMTTAHSAKGDQYDVAFLLPDFERTIQEMIDDKKQFDELHKQHPTEQSSKLTNSASNTSMTTTTFKNAKTEGQDKFQADTANLNLIYVAISRARRKLYLPPILYHFLVKRTMDPPPHAVSSQQKTLESCWKLPQKG
jgi:hypothetical protein